MIVPTSPSPEATARGLAELIAQMARQTARYPFKRWGFGESIAMEALLAAGGEPGRFAAELVTGWARDHAPLAGDPLAHVAPGVPLLILAEREGNRAEPLLGCAYELATVLAESAVGRHGAQIHRPDLAGWEHEVWVDCMHLDGPFLSLLARLSGDPGYADLAGEILLGHARVLQTERSGLFSHGFDDATGRANGVHWGRGQGWALLGLVDTAANLPHRHPARGEIGQRLDGLVRGLAATEAALGVWHTVVDAPETYVESSVGAFVALGVGRAVRRGLLPTTWSALVDRSWEAVARRVSPDGDLEGVSDATPVGPNALHYGGRARGSFPWGQGPALLAAVERLRDREATPEVRHG
jgi:unsaturated rhamnogalacturonyl hydrolase